MIKNIKKQVTKFNSSIDFEKFILVIIQSKQFLKINFKIKK